METKQIKPYKNHCAHCDFTFSLTVPEAEAKANGFNAPFKTEVVCPNAKCGKQIIAIATLI